MELVIGATYSSPNHGQYIKVIDVQYESDYECILLVDYIEKDGTGQDPDQQLIIPTKDLNRWTMVKYV